MRFDQYIPEIQSCFSRIFSKIEKGKSSPVKQNEAHGLMIRVNIFQHAYFTYRDFNQTITGKSVEEESAQRRVDEGKILECVKTFESKYDQSLGSLSLVIVSLYVKSLRFLMKQNGVFDSKMIRDFNEEYYGRLMATLADEGALSKGGGSKKPVSSPDQQVYLKDLTKTCFTL